jgi:hypothetical protein
VTALGVKPQNAKLDGATLRLTFDVLAFPTRVMPKVPGLQANESPLVPVPTIAGNVIVTGLTAQVTFGDELAAKPTAAYAPAMMRLIERPMMRCGRYRLITNGNYKSRGRVLGT